MSPKGGRPRTFPTAVVPLALERRERTGETWAEIARDLGVCPGTLRARAADHKRVNSLHKTPVPASDGGRTGPRTSRTSDGGGM